MGTKNDFYKGNGCFQFREAVVTSTAKEAYALLSTVHYKFSMFYRSGKCRVQLINFSSEGKVML